MNRSVIGMAGGSAAVIIGVTIQLINPKSTLAGGIIGLLGLVACVWSYIDGGIDDREERKWRNDSLSEMKTSNKNISDLVNEIRQDRIERNKLR